MSLRPDPVFEVPAETARVARAAFPKGNLCLRLRDVLGPLFEDVQFSALFPARGRPAISPGRLALVSVLQCVEGLPDRQAAEAVRSRIDWKYALGLELTDPGFDFSVLCEFRSRLLEAGDEHVLDRLLERLREVGLVKAGRRQRSDSTHVLAAIRTLNRLELVAETMRAALEALAVAAPDWLAGQADAVWAERYGKRVDEQRLPKDDAARLAYAHAVGADGVGLLRAIDDEQVLGWLRHIPAVQTLRRIWAQQYHCDQDPPAWREGTQMVPATERETSPYDADARYGAKNGVGWTGYKVHLTETCEPDGPHVIVNLTTTAAPVADNKMTATIHTGLAERRLLPQVHLIDSGYTSAELLVSSRSEFGIELFGPAGDDCSWQTLAGQGFDVGGFAIDWDARTVTCPEGKTSANWSPWRTKAGEAAIHVDFAKADCAACPVRSACTRARHEPRQLTLHPRPVHEALHQARREQGSTQWKERYAVRAGVEGTISQGVRAFGLRRCRYLGLAKAHLQHVLTAAAINLVRIDAWLTETPRACTRVSHFTALQATAA